ncbi:type VI secretion system baseplate subunit TssF, partial [Pseudomonas shirazica]
DNPQLARLLGKGASDPDVERLMEAFAFLTAKLRLKLEDDLPELTHPMLQLLWPNYLRPLPSATIIKFSPVRQSLSQSQR